MGLIALAPGMQGVGAQDQMATRGLTFAAGTGSRNSYGGLGVSFDGVINKEVTLQRGEPEIPSLDALSQFKVLSTGASAEFNEPTQVIVVSSSGTNTFHGELFRVQSLQGYFGQVLLLGQLLFARPTSAMSTAAISPVPSGFRSSTTAKTAPSSSLPMRVST